MTSGKFEFQSGDLLYSKIRPYLNKVALADRPGLCSADMYAIQAGSYCDVGYLYRYLQTQEFLSYAALFSGRANIPKLNREQLLKCLIPLPPLKEQRRIAAILDKADALRRKRKRAMQLLDGLTQSMFVDRFGSRKDWLASEQTISLFEICAPKQWKTISSSEMTPDGYPVYGANGKIGYFSDFNHEKRTVLITCRGASCGTINVCAPKSYVTGNAMALDDLDVSRITLDYLVMALKLRGVNDAITGTAQPQITRQSLSAVTFPLPSMAEQQAFLKGCKAAQKVRPSLQSLAEQAEILFASLQHRAFSGQL